RARDGCGSGGRSLVSRSLYRFAGGQLWQHLCGGEFLVDARRWRLSGARIMLPRDARSIPVHGHADRPAEDRGPVAPPSEGLMQHRLVETYDTGVATHVGRVRGRNEDSYLVRPDVGLWAVADGMGGHVDGELASRIVIEALQTIQTPASAADLL